MKLALSHRKATMDDVPEIRSLINASIRLYIGAVLDAEQVEASFELMGVDTQLIEDMTYFVVERNDRIVGCGGWSRRATLYGGDQTRGRDARMLDPTSEAARVRAMYVHPEFGRQGIGSYILDLCEAAARQAGFGRIELMSTVSGDALYLQHGFQILESITVPTRRGVGVPLTRMSKVLVSAAER